MFKAIVFKALFFLPQWTVAATEESVCIDVVTLTNPVGVRLDPFPPPNSPSLVPYGAFYSLLLLPERKSLCYALPRVRSTKISLVFIRTLIFKDSSVRDRQLFSSSQCKIAKATHMCESYDAVGVDDDDGGAIGLKAGVVEPSLLSVVAKCFLFFLLFCACARLS